MARPPSHCGLKARQTDNPPRARLVVQAQIRSSGVLELASAVATAAGVWHNLTKDKECFEIASEAPPPAPEPAPYSALEAEATTTPSHLSTTEMTRHRQLAPVGSCPTCPPCDDCPPCPVRRRRRLALLPLTPPSRSVISSCTLAHI